MRKPRRMNWASVILTTVLLGCGSVAVLAFTQAYIAAQAKASFVAGRHHLSRGEYGAAIHDLRFVVEHQPSFGAARYYLGCALYEQGKAEAKLQWNEVLVLLPPANPYHDKTRQKLAASARWQ